MIYPLRRGSIGCSAYLGAAATVLGALLRRGMRRAARVSGHPLPPLYLDGRDVPESELDCSAAVTSSTAEARDPRALARLPGEWPRGAETI